MPFQIHKVQVWSGELSDRAGAAAAMLEVLARAGADLEFVFTRPHPNRPDAIMIFLAPVSGPEQLAAARAVGLAPALDVAMLCVEGDNRAGIGYEVMSKLAVAGLDLRGLSISAVGNRFAAYLAFDNPDTATLAGTSTEQAVRKSRVRPLPGSSCSGRNLVRSGPRLGPSRQSSPP